MTLHFLSNSSDWELLLMLLGVKLFINIRTCVNVIFLCLYQPVAYIFFLNR